MNLLRPTRLLAALGAAFALAAPAHALIVTSGSNTLGFNWSYDTGSSILTGYGSMTVSGFDSSQLTLGVQLFNTSLNLGQGGDRLVGFAFGIDPDATSLGFSDVADGGMVAAGWVAGGVFSTHVPGVEVCALGGQNCSGGGNGGIFAGSNDSFSILLGGSWGSSVDISPVGVRFQTGIGSFTFGGTLVPGPNDPQPGPPVAQVPEPGSLALLSLGLLGVAAGRRRGARR